MGLIPKEVIDEVQSRSDIVEVVSSYLPLKRSGANFKALCPFHREKTPSFMVSPSKQIWHCFGCFPSGSLIKTEIGFHKIEDVQAGQLVLTHRGRLMPVIRTLWRPYNGKIIEIYTRKSNLPVKLTTDHEVFVIKTKNCQYKSRKTRICQWRCKLRCTGKFFKKYKMEKLSAGQLSINDYLLYPINRKVNDAEFVDLNNYYNRKESNFGPDIYPIPTKVKVDDKFLKLIGYWEACGSKHRAYIRFSLGAHEKEFAKEIEELIKTIFHIKTSIHIRKRHGKTGLEITACNSKLSNIFENLCGKREDYKHIPFEFQNLPLRKQEVILNAIFKGDGHTGKVAKCKENRKYKSVTITSLVLAEQLKDILLRLGVSPNFIREDAKVDKKKTRHKTSYAVSWQHNIKLHFSDIIQMNNVFYQILPIRKIVKKEFIGDVYNLTVAKDHSYTTPNFVVGNCGQGGNVVNFVMKYENLQFPEAVRSLAKRAGIDIPEDLSGVSTEAKSRLRMLYEINELAAEYYRANLLDYNIGRAAREYLKRREIGDETSQRFRLGYAPDRWEGFLAHARRAGWSEGLLEQAGLILPAKVGTYYDRFRNKLIFPIADLQGRVVGFGSRVLDDSLPKYINSPETDLFRKGRNLYGLNLAREHTRVDNRIVIVEGYMDCLTLYQNGIKNVVASLGTALTQDQVRLLKRFIQTVVMVYDSDQAGEAASLRGLDLVIEEDLRCRVVRLPSGFDPDDYVRDRGREGFQSLLRDAPDLFDYKLELLASRYDSTRVEDVAKITAEMLPTVSRVANAVLRSGYIKELARRLAVDEGALWLELRKVKGRGSTYYEPQVQQPSPMRSEEKTLIGLMLEDRDVGIIVKDNLAAEDFQDPRARKVVAYIFESIAQGRSYDPARLMSHVGDDDVSQLISWSLARPDEFLDRTKVASDCIKRMREARLARKRLTLQREIKLAEATGDETRVIELLREFQDKDL